MNRPAAIVVALLSAAASAGAQPELCGPNPTLSVHGLNVAQSYEKRVPSPRWVGVTVVEYHRLDGTTLDVLESDRYLWVGETIIDRCEILVIHARGADGSTIEMVNPSTGRRTELVVAESPKAICAALDDCAAPLLEVP